ncbi:MAG: hypothetical protein A2Y62_11195 [Candidatus Fischerbacteria bacterium RBG_13_37_8]|uniref:Glycosyltransferase RgtA/B/C/D-like domain-containing protein n=1 Tax=Candidatus Fischerbacteria bacterium RBG_13_37_8 TaxID=1817863 RepID=A0A1F5VW78_9BACT|nr:MAG: hypothetical protein A2Y62_11195 [Candidatus Fischerbacteria bacterium RBG_13_37_8]
MVFIYLAITVVLYLVSAPLNAKSDGLIYYAMAEAFSQHRLSLEEEMYLDAYLSTRSLGKFYSDDLKLTSFYYPGSALLYYPFFKCADVLSNLSVLKQNNILFSTVSPLPFSRIAMLWFANFLFLFISFLLMHLIIKNLFNLRNFQIAAIIFMLFLSTSWICYSTLEYMFIHNMEIMVSSAFLLCWLRQKNTSIHHFFALGFLFSLLVSIRLINATIYILFITYSLYKSRCSNSRYSTRLNASILLIAGGLPAALFLAYYNQQIFGNAFSMGYPKNLLVWSLGFPEALSSFFSILFSYFFHPVRGLFIWHPLLLLSFIGIFAYHNNTSLKKLMLFSLALFTLIISQYKIWWGGGTYGQRFFLSLLPFFAIGLSKIFSYKSKTVVVILTLLTLYSLCIYVLYLGGARKNSDEFYTPYSFIKEAYHDPQFIKNSIAFNTIKNPHNAFVWLINIKSAPAFTSKSMTHSDSVHQFKLALPDSLQNQTVSFALQIYTDQEKKFPKQFLLSARSAKTELTTENNIFKISHLGLPSPLITTSLNEKPLRIRQLRINNNTLLDETNEITLIIGIIDHSQQKLVHYYETTINQKYDFAENAFMKKSLLYDSNNPLLLKYKAISLEDGNIIYLFWKAKGNIPFFIEKLVADKNQDLILPEGLKPLSQQYFKGTMWVIAEKKILFY